MKRLAVVLILLAAEIEPAPRGRAILNPAPQPRDTGFRGIWYYNQPSKDEYRYKYSGGFATYPQQHIPMAIYSKEANKTFFVYGGTVPGKQELLHMVSYWDHKTGMVPRPTILLNKQTNDAHDNPTLSIDDQGYLWVFSSAHGTARASYVHKSQRPYSVDAFDLVLTANFSYTQPWHVPGKGFLFLHTRYSPGRHLFWMTSPDGESWDQPQILSRFGVGHYQISWPFGSRIATAFDYHPEPLGLNARTNLYYVTTDDMGRTWKTILGKAVSLPLADAKNVALVRDYKAEALLVYLKDLQFDAQAQPVILYLTSKGYESGPKNDPRTWWTARWTGKLWEYREMTTSDHNYDHGSLYIEADGTWRVIAPTDPGPQQYCTGGEMVMWTSRDQGKSWKRSKTLTSNSEWNHTYARRPLNAHPEFYVFWADGNPLEPSGSRLYFADRSGRVFQLPVHMKSDLEKPQPWPVQARR